MKPLTVLVYDEFPPEVADTPLKLRIEGVKAPVKYNIKYIRPPEDIYEKPIVSSEEGKLHGLSVVKFFLQSTDELNKLNFDIIAAQTPVSTGREQIAYKEFSRLSDPAKIQKFTAAAYLDSLVTKHKPDLIISSTSWDDSNLRDIFERHTPETEENFTRQEEAFKAVTRLRNTPMFYAAINTNHRRDLQGATAESGWQVNNSDAPFLVLGNTNNSFFLTRNRSGTLHSFLNNDDPDIAVLTSFFSKKRLRPVKRLRGNSYVNPMFAGMATSILTQGSSDYKKQLGFSLSLKLLLVDAVKNIKAAKDLNLDLQAKDMLTIIGNSAAASYNKEAKNRGLEKTVVPNQVFIDNTYNNAPLLNRDQK